MNALDYYYQGSKLVQQGDYDAAIELFNTALGEYPDSFTLISIRGTTYHQKGDTDKAMADYTRMTILLPQDPDGWNNRGYLYHELGEYDKAIADYTRCIPLSPANYGTYWSNRGIVYYDKGDLDAALADLNQSIACWTDPECSGWALYHRGLVWKKKGDFDKALEDFRLAATYDPDNADIFYQAGHIWLMRREHDKAIECFSKAIAAKDDEADYWHARGACYWNKCLKNNTNFWDEEGTAIGLAEDDYTKAIACNPGMADAYFNRGMLRGSKARENNNLIQAILTQKATDEAERVVLLAQLGHIGGKALIPQADALLRGLRSNRDQADVILAESFGLFAEDDAREAIEDLSQAITLEPDHAEAYYHRGLAYTLLGEKDKARADYEQTLALDPNHARAAEKLMAFPPMDPL
jgi:tetratricopeptide (TPR) repeat protein